MNSPRSQSYLRQILVCPTCKGRLNFSETAIECWRCNFVFRQTSREWFELLPGHLLKKKNPQWEERLQDMEEWYHDLMNDTAHAKYCFSVEKHPYAAILASLSGDILDIGGGHGLPRHFLSENTRYVVLDPSLYWILSDWSSMTESFPCLKEKPDFVRGVGEYLPFPSRSFDAALSFMSLNHAGDPKGVLDEVARVLRPGGRFLLVVEDMIPTWSDLFDPFFPAAQVYDWFYYQEPHPGKLTLLDRLRLKLSGIRARFLMVLKLLRGDTWPLQKDHIRLWEKDLQNWTAANFEMIKRKWVEEYLMIELKRKPMDQ